MESWETASSSRSDPATEWSTKNKANTEEFLSSVQHRWIWRAQCDLTWGLMKRLTEPEGTVTTKAEKRWGDAGQGPHFSGMKGGSSEYNRVADGTTSDSVHLKRPRVWTRAVTLQSCEVTDLPVNLTWHSTMHTNIVHLVISHKNISKG